MIFPLMIFYQIYLFFFLQLQNVEVTLSDHVQAVLKPN